MSDIAAASTHRLAVLIDAENASVRLIAPILAEIATLGTVSVRRIYGDFTSQQMASWSAILLDNSIQPIQQYRSVAGKGSSDSALIIDAMDLLYTRQLDGFCIVSSDSDFTRLATRLREDGRRVYGFGEQKTPKSFVNACDRFTFVEIFRDAPKPDAAPAAQSAKPLLKLDNAMMNVLAQAVGATEDEQGRANLGEVGSYLGKRMPEFDPRNYGHKKLVDLFAKLPGYAVTREKRGNGTMVFVEATGRAAP